MSMTHDELRFPAAIPVLRAGRVELRPFVEADAGELEALIDDA
jgi:hypothetical protein